MAEAIIDTAVAAAPAAAPAPADTIAAATAAAAPATTTAADASQAKGATTATTDAGATTAAPAAGTETKGFWPEGWQARIAGEDKDELKQLARYASPEDVWKKARSLERRLSSGEFRTALPKNPKPEELAAWRKDNGIPEAPEKYDLTGLTIPEEDREIVGGFLQRAHEHNMSPAQARASLESYYSIQAKQLEERAARDEEQKAAALDTLNAEWGQSFRRNVNIIEGTVLSKFPENVRQLLKSARLPDGTALFNNVDALKGFAALALELNPAGVVTPASGGDIGKGMIDEYNDIQKMRREDRASYVKNEGVQQRERELIDAMIKNGIMDANGNMVGRKAA